MMMIRLLALLALLPTLAFGQMEPELPTPPAPPEPKPAAPQPEAETPAKPKPPVQPKPAAKTAKKAKKPKKKKPMGSPFGNPDVVVKKLGLEGEPATQAKALILQLVRTQQETYKQQRQRIGAAYKAFFEEMKTVLTPPQYQKLLQMRRNRRKAKGKKGKGKKGKANNKKKRPSRALRARSTRAMRVLKATPEEAAVLQPLVESVLHTRDVLKREERRRLAKLRKAMNETTDPKLTGKLLKDFRTAQADADTTLKKHEQQLVEVLTPAQELKLVGIGILR